MIFVVMLTCILRAYVKQLKVEIFSKILCIQLIKTKKIKFKCINYNKIFLHLAH